MYNKSNIMRTANGYAKTMSRSEALRRAWAEAKAPKMIFMGYSDFEAAFKTKYPTGSFTAPIMMQNTMTVQFTTGGKKYT